MHLLDPRFRSRMKNYFFQCFLATGMIFLALSGLNVLTHTALLATLGATTFIVFCIPNSGTAQYRTLIGGYTVGMLIGIILCYVAHREIMTFLPDYVLDVIFGGLAVGLAMFIMVLTNTEHPPAAGLALGLVINSWDFYTLGTIMVLVMFMALVKHLLHRFLIDLL